MKSADVKAILANLATAAGTGGNVYSLINNSTDATIFDDSVTGYYGITDSCYDDINTCIYILNGVYNKLYEAIHG